MSTSSHLKQPIDGVPQNKVKSQPRTPHSSCAFVFIRGSFLTAHENHYPRNHTKHTYPLKQMSKLKLSELVLQITGQLRVIH